MSARRDAILRAAVSSVARNGVRGLRVEDVARAAGVSLGLVYYYFDDRSGLLGETFSFVDDRAGSYSCCPPSSPAGCWPSRSPSTT